MSDIDTIERELRAIGVDPFASVDQFSGLSRIDAARHAHDEKTTRRSVHSARVAIKAYKGPLRLGPDALSVPAGMNIDAPTQVFRQLSTYRAIILIENWEAFESFHLMPLNAQRIEESPEDVLVLYRGGKSLYPIEASSTLVKQLAIPVYPAFDFDPQGLMMALTTPHFKAALFPPHGLLEQSLQIRGLPTRYQTHLHQCEALLNAATEESIIMPWALMRRYCSALPQEAFFSL